MAASHSRQFARPAAGPATLARGSAVLASLTFERAVHLDDVARITNHEPWPYPLEGRRLAIDAGVDIACHRIGRTALLRALYKQGFADGHLSVLYFLPRASRWAHEIHER
jgi:hypothetical protein